MKYVDEISWAKESGNICLGQRAPVVALVLWIEKTDAHALRWASEFSQRENRHRENTGIRTRGAAENTRGACAPRVVTGQSNWSGSRNW